MEHGHILFSDDSNLLSSTPVNEKNRRINTAYDSNGRKYRCGFVLKLSSE